jgi:glycerol uptake facilitator-like aquaporin
MIDIFLAELLGTFVFLSVIILSGHASTEAKDALSWIKIGLSLSIVIILLSKISACFNPAVSLMLYLNKDITFDKMIIGICGQILGAILAYFYYVYVKQVKK